MTQPIRKAMIETYKEISEKTNSKLYNPPIPKDAEKLFMHCRTMRKRCR